MIQALDINNKCAKISPYTTPPTNYIDVVRGGKLLFRFDPIRGLVECQHRGEKHIVDLGAIDDRRYKKNDNAG